MKMPVKRGRGRAASIFGFITVLILLSGCFGCKSRETDSRDVLAVSVEPQKHILEKIVGDRYRVVSVIPSGADPESFEPSPSVRMDVEDSKIFFVTGLLPFENKISDSSRDKNKITNVLKDIPLIYGTHSHSHDSESENKNLGAEEASADPHVWTSVRNMRQMAINMAAKVEEIDPENADFYRSNLNQYISHLDSLDNYFKGQLAEKNMAFLVWHPSLTYFARDYGLEQIAVSSQAKEMSAKILGDIIDEAKEDGVRVMFHQQEYDTRQAQTIANSIGAKVVTVNPSSYDWENELTLIVNELARQ